MTDAGPGGEEAAERLLIYDGWTITERQPHICGHRLDFLAEHPRHDTALIEVKVWESQTSGKDTVKKAIADAYDLKAAGVDTPYLLILSHDLTGLHNDMLHRAMRTGAIWQVLVLTLVPLTLTEERT